MRGVSNSGNYQGIGIFFCYFFYSSFHKYFLSSRLLLVAIIFASIIICEWGSGQLAEGEPRLLVQEGQSM